MSLHDSSRKAEMFNVIPRSLVHQSCKELLFISWILDGWGGLCPVSRPKEDGPDEGATATAGIGRQSWGQHGWCVITRSLPPWITSPHVLLQCYDNLVTWHLCELTGGETACDSSNQPLFFPCPPEKHCPCGANLSDQTQEWKSWLQATQRLVVPQALRDRRGEAWGWVRAMDSLCMTVECGITSPFICQHSQNSQQEERALVHTAGISWS